MQIRQYIYSPDSGWTQKEGTKNNKNIKPDLLIAFGSGNDCNGDILTAWWQQSFPEADLIGCSTSGEICDTTITTNTMIVTAIEFSSTSFKVIEADFDQGVDSYQLAERLCKDLDTKDLQLCFVMSDGLHINGTQLANGFNDFLPANIPVTGGLAGDGTRFKQTQICHNERYGERKIILLALYGQHIEVRHSASGGWSPFGPSRLITKSASNALYELDGKSALDLYKRYLGKFAEELPSSGLRFPLEITLPSGEKYVRTLLSIDDDGAMIFAGDLPEGTYARFMHATYDRLVDGAITSAKNITAGPYTAPDLAILISCVGRRRVLGQRAEEEVEAVRDELGNTTPICGYYSYGEFSPIPSRSNCTLHNQTMAITTLREVG